ASGRGRTWPAPAGPRSTGSPRTGWPAALRRRATRPRRPRCTPLLASRSPRPHRPLVVRLGAAQISFRELLPARRILRRGDVLSLERLIAVVVGCAGGEMSAVLRLDDTSGHPAGDAEGRDAGGGQVRRADEPLAGYVGAGGGRREQVVEVQVRAKELCIPRRVRPVQVDQRGV